MTQGWKRWLKRIFIAGILCTVAFLVLSSRGPQYQGKSVRYWFKEYYLGYDRWDRKLSEDEVLTALRTIGTNALPHLLEKAFSEVKDSSLRSNYHEFTRELPRSWNFARFVKSDEIWRRAVQTIRDVIRPPVEVVLPLVQNELDHTNRERRNRAIGILRGLTNGSASLVPVSIKLLRDPDPRTQAAGAILLAEAGPKAAAAVPELLALLGQATWTNDLQRNCIWALGSIGSNAAPALPLLTQLFRAETDVSHRTMLASVICRIDPQQDEAMNYLLEGLKQQQTNSQAVVYAAFMVATLGPEEKRAMPTLVEALDRETNSLFWPLVLTALKRMNPPVETYLPALKQKLKAPDESSRFIAANAILEVEPASPEAQSVMVTAIETHSTNEPLAIYALGQARASELVSVILKAFDGTNIASWENVGEALETIAPLTEPSLSQLKEKLKTSTGRLRETVAVAIIYVDPKDTEARTILIQQLKVNLSLGAIIALAKAEPPAKEAIPLLRGGLKADNPQYIRAAADAIRQIEAKQKK